MLLSNLSEMRNYCTVLIRGMTWSELACNRFTPVAVMTIKKKDGSSNTWHEVIVITQMRHNTSSDQCGGSSENLFYSLYILKIMPIGFVD